MLRRSLAIGLSLSLLAVANMGFTQVGPGARSLGPDFNIYNADNIPEDVPTIVRLASEISLEEATAILQRELAAAQFFGLDGVIAEHWGSADTTPESTATRTLVVDRRGLSWRSMAPDEEEVVATFAFEDAVQIWSRFSMAERDASTDPPTDSPQGVVLYLLTEGGADDVFQDPINLSKILPNYPDLLPTYIAARSARPLAASGLFFEAGSPAGFAVCCFSSTGFSPDGMNAHLPIGRLPLVIAAFQRLAPNLEYVDHAGLLFSVPNAEPTSEEADVITALCNRDGFDNQGVVLCQHNQLHGLAFMKIHSHGDMPGLIYICEAEEVGDYEAQATCVTQTMMEQGP